MPRIPLCLFHWITGLPCPLCGLTRGVFALAQGHWREALRFHALTPLAVLMLVSLLRPGALRDRIWRAGLPVLLVYGICRWWFPI